MILLLSIVDLLLSITDLLLSIVDLLLSIAGDDLPEVPEAVHLEYE